MRGANTQPRELFHIAAIRTLPPIRLGSEVYSRAAASGRQPPLTLDEFPGQTFHGTLVRNANAIDIASRTLLVEVDVDNPTGQLLPGALRLCAPQAPRPNSFGNYSIEYVDLPQRRLAGRTGPRWQKPSGSNQIGRDYGNSVEIVSGLQATDNVIVDPSDSLVTWHARTPEQ